MSPGGRRRLKAPEKAVPERKLSGRDEVWRAFAAANDAHRAFVRRCHGVDVNRARFPNPFVPLRFRLATGLAVMVAHHRRHVCQLARALERAR
jgi:hypothetical protein